MTTDDERPVTDHAEEDGPQIRPEPLDPPEQLAADSEGVADFLDHDDDDGPELEGEQLAP